MTTTVIAMIQARMSSRRLPGKMLMPLGGTPLLGVIIENLRHCPALDGLWVATSDHPDDDPLAAFATDAGVCVHRGPLDNVALRLLQAAEAAEADAIARVNGDSPLLDPALVAQGVDIFRQERPDLVTNVFPRSFPKGQSVEVIGRQALARAVAAMTSANEREHVTPYFYAHADKFRLRSFAADNPRPELQLSVDEWEDFTRCAAIVEHLGVPAWQAGWRHCVQAADTLALA